MNDSVVIVNERTGNAVESNDVSRSSSNGRDMSLPPTRRMNSPRAAPMALRSSSGNRRNNNKSTESKGDSVSKEESESDRTCCICLRPEKVDETKVDNCSHTFCFSCISEWMLINQVCPACKSPVTTLEHTLDKKPLIEQVRAVKNRLQALRSAASGNAVPIMDERLIVRQRLKMIRKALATLQEYMNRPRLSNSERMRQRKQYQQMVNERTAYSSLLDEIDQNSITRSSLMGHSLFRALVYEYSLEWSSVVSNANHIRFNISSLINPEDERRHYARLMPWLMRELAMLFSDRGLHNPQVRAMAEYIYKFLKQNNIHTPQLTKVMMDYGLSRRRADIFEHELYNFACSNVDMLAHDSTSTYTCAALRTSQADADPNRHVFTVEEDVHDRNMNAENEFDDDSVVALDDDADNQQADRRARREGAQESNYLREVLSSDTDGEDNIYMNRSLLLSDHNTNDIHHVANFPPRHPEIPPENNFSTPISVVDNFHNEFVTGANPINRLGFGMPRPSSSIFMSSGSWSNLLGSWRLGENSSRAASASPGLVAGEASARARRMKRRGNRRVPQSQGSGGSGGSQNAEVIELSSDEEAIPEHLLIESLETNRGESNSNNSERLHELPTSSTPSWISGDVINVDDPSSSKNAGEQGGMESLRPVPSGQNPLRPIPDGTDGPCSSGNAARLNVLPPIHTVTTGLSRDVKLDVCADIQKRLVERRSMNENTRSAPLGHDVECKPNVMAIDAANIADSNVPSTSEVVDFSGMATPPAQNVDDNDLDTDMASSRSSDTRPMVDLSYQMESFPNYLNMVAKHAFDDAGQGDADAANESAMNEKKPKKKDKGSCPSPKKQVERMMAINPQQLSTWSSRRINKLVGAAQTILEMGRDELERRKTEGQTEEKKNCDGADEVSGQSGSSPRKSIKVGSGSDNRYKDEKDKCSEKDSDAEKRHHKDKNSDHIRHHGKKRSHSYTNQNEEDRRHKSLSKRSKEF